MPALLYLEASDTLQRSESGLLGKLSQVKDLSGLWILSVFANRRVIRRYGDSGISPYGGAISSKLDCGYFLVRGRSGREVSPA